MLNVRARFPPAGPARTRFQKRHERSAGVDEGCIRVDFYQIYGSGVPWYNACEVATSDLRIAGGPPGLTKEAPLIPPGGLFLEVDHESCVWNCPLEQAGAISVIGRLAGDTKA